MISAVLFDFYGTLARAVRWGPTCEEVIAGHGLRLDEPTLSQWRAEIFDGQEHSAHSASREDYMTWERERLRRLAAACGADGDDTLEAVVADLWAASKDFVLAAYPEVPAVLSEIRRRGQMVAVCSNWGWDLDRALEQAGLTALVDAAVTSAQAGARKPHPRIFHHALAVCGVRSDQALFVGDSWYPDVEGPLAAGMPAVHVWRDDCADSAPPPLPPGAYRVQDLRPVTQLAGTYAPGGAET